MSGFARSLASKEVVSHELAAVPSNANVIH
jgi:hypothetical protein